MNAITNWSKAKNELREAEETLSHAFGQLYGNFPFAGAPDEEAANATLDPLRQAVKEAEEKVNAAWLAVK